MKRNLVKILAMSSLMLTLGACGGNKKPVEPTPTDDTVELTFTQLTKLVDGKWEYADKYVTIKDAAVYGVSNNGKTLVIAPEYKENGTEQSGGAQVELKEAYNFEQKTRGFGAKATIKGKVTDVDGHVTLQDAEVISMSERDYTSGSRKEGTGADLCIWSLNDPVRENFDKLGRADAFMCWDFDDVALCSVPEAYDGSKDVEFYVNFPGENPFIDDDMNFDRIKVTIPKGSYSGFAPLINNAFSKYKVGDQLGGFYVNTTYANNEVQFLLEPAWALYANDEEQPTYAPAENPVFVETSYNHAIANYDDEKYINGMPSFKENEKVYRYDVQDLYASKISDLSGKIDLSFVDTSLEANGGLVIVSGMTTYEYAPTLLEEWGKDLLAAGFVKQPGATEASANFRLTQDEVVNADVQLNVAYDETMHYCVEMLFVGRRADTDLYFATFAEAVAKYNDRIGGTFESALPALPVTPSESGVTFSWLNKTTFDGAKTYEFLLDFDNDAFADDAAYEAYANAYAEALIDAGFLDNGMYLVNEGSIDGFYNVANGELAVIDLEQDDEEHYVGISIMVMHVEDTSYFFADDAAFVWTDLSAANYAARMWGQITQRTYTPSKTSNGYGFSMGAWMSTGRETIIQYSQNYCIPECANALDPVAQQGYTFYSFELNGNNGGNKVVMQIGVSDNISDPEGDYFRIQMMTYFSK